MVRLDWKLGSRIYGSRGRELFSYDSRQERYLAYSYPQNEARLLIASDLWANPLSEPSELRGFNRDLSFIRSTAALS